MNEPNRPNCLHVPQLYGGEAPLFYWEDVPGAALYELDAVYDDTIENLTIGRTWAEIDYAGADWREGAAAGADWAALDTLPALGRTWANLALDAQSWQQLDDQEKTWRDISRLPVCLAVWRGAGQPVPVADAGLTWQEAERHQKSWQEAEPADLTWWDITFAKQKGLTFIQVDGEGLDWDGMARLGPEDIGYTWHQLDSLPAQGMAWEGADARCQSWETLDATDRNWQQLEHLPPDNQPHSGCRIPVPKNAFYAHFRLRALVAGGQGSPYIQSARRGVIAVEEADLVAQAGQIMPVLLQSALVRGYEDTAFTLYYNAGHLRFDGLALQAGGHLLPLPRDIQLLENTPGRLRFACIRAIPDGQLYSGLLMLLVFAAKAGVLTCLRLERETYGTKNCI